MNITCTLCEQSKSDDCFAWKNKKSGKKHPHCKDCQKIRSNEWYKNNKEKHCENVKVNNKNYTTRNRDFIWEYMSKHKCIDCGETDPIVLEFDHRDPELKEDTVYRMGQSKCSLKKLKIEIDKCDIRCANCHRRKTAKQLGWWKDKGV